MWLAYRPTLTVDDIAERAAGEHHLSYGVALRTHVDVVPTSGPGR